MLLELKGERVCTDILCIEVYFRPTCGERMLHVLDSFPTVLCLNLHSKLESSLALKGSDCITKDASLA